MTFSSSPRVQEVLLIILMVCYGWTLSNDVAKHASRQKKVESMSKSAMQYRSPVGITADGNPIKSPGPRADRYVVFLLHADSLRSDLGFWNSASIVLGPQSRTALIAYCGGTACSEMAQQSGAHRFPILQYGDAVSIQALVDADSYGAAIV